MFLSSYGFSFASLSLPKTWVEADPARLSSLLPLESEALEVQQLWTCASAGGCEQGRLQYEIF